MTTASPAERIEHWRGGVPPLTGALDPDAALLAGHVRAGGRLLAELPPAPRRDAGQRQAAARVHDSCRRLRAEFLARHAAALYARLTEDRTRHPRLADLVAAATERFEGVLPSRGQQDADLLLPQAEREGWEIDQGLFVRALLRDPASGAHLMDAMRLPTARALDLLDGFRRTGLVELPTVRLERTGPAAHLTIDDPAHLNAETDRLVADMETAVDLVLLADEVRVGILRGAVMTHPRYAGRRVFSAGINLKDLRDGRLSFVDFLMTRELGLVTKLAHGLRRLGADAVLEDRTAKPWVAAVDTFAIGGGMQLLLVCDWVIAASDAYLSLPAAQEGIVPGVANLRLGRHTGGRLARRLILGGRRVEASGPDGPLLCDEVVPPEEMDKAVEAAAEAFQAPAVAANRSMLALAEEPLDHLRGYLAEFAYVQACRLYSPDVLDKVGRFGAARGTR